jgi:cell wall-associated NlpC family hydrolase
MIIQKLTDAIQKFTYKIWSKFLTIVGDVRVSKFPIFMMYDPGMYFDVNGSDVLKIMSIIKPGDILIRGFGPASGSTWLDCVFIPDSTGYSHGAIYVGKNKVIHAVAEGVSYINLIDFLDCDRIRIYHPKAGSTAAIKRAKALVKAGTPYDFGFKLGASAIYCFELIPTCYPKLDIRPMEIQALHGLIKKEAYVAQSFVESPDLELIYESNKKYGIKK